MDDGKKLVSNFINLSLYLNENYDSISKLEIIPQPKEKAKSERVF